jgi:hypothetical protein
VVQVIEALRYKPEVRGFHSRWDFLGICNLLTSSGHPMTLTSIRLVTEINNKDISLG